MKRAFTLIELLVVIAIIAILAAILFPVFAQAKEAAKKTAALSQTKQFGTGTAIYLTDADDTMPLATTTRADGSYRTGTIHPFPSGSIGSGWDSPQLIADVGTQWANSLYPYIKNYDLYNFNGQSKTTIPGEVFSTNAGAPAPQISGLTYNGLLNQLNASSIDGPSTAVMLWGGMGNTSLRGRSAANPQLSCTVNGTPGNPVPCVFNAGGAPQAGGAASGLVSLTYGFGNWNSGYKVWAIGNGTPIVRADTSAKFQRVGNLVNKTAAEPSQGFGSAFTDPYNRVFPSTTYPGTHSWGYWGCNNGGGVGDGFDPNGSQIYYHCFFRPDRIK